MEGAHEGGWPALLGADPVPWLLASGEPSARWLALTGLLDRGEDDPEVGRTHAEVLGDPLTGELIGRLPDWEAGANVSGHDSPSFAPNLLGLLADMGVRRGDSPVLDRMLEAMLRHQDEAGRFMTCALRRTEPDPAWGALLCDTHAITGVLVRFGFADDPRVAAAIARMRADFTETSSGPAWPCLPSLGFRGPGRRDEACPQVTLEAVRVLASLPAEPASEGFVAARTLLGIWRDRGERQPYMFGHGARFKTVKWPPFWYSPLAVLDAVGRHSEVFDGPDSRPEDRQSAAELAACLVAYNVGPDGRVTPRSCYRGFEAFSFGQKKRASPFATALLATVLRRFEPLAREIAAVDVLTLHSSKGGSGTPRPPRG